ncbi:hypothetical protein DSM104443_02917 [Usitatibacter rugosus]|uniref:phosphoenolpyruvate--protein phosphotransferase n=1 Tax=Usitatibacter rugosus TaxID=2732067 RepID=A0A6M4GZ77_9PROT|nr:phosphoenolpyruvate--protein phosphotransferase [Usitatibacter rugosus]QJR11834.1 hypothetical protein DSM104443_02917 [Usitatibacter rugosus]
MTTIVVRSPLAGWCLPLEEVPDAVFAQKMAGEGVAIEPTDGIVHAPCDGEVLFPKEARHALTVRTAGGQDVLIHVGIDTVKLDGAGFQRLVAAGQRVRAGEPVLQFDLDLVARKAASAATPVLVTAGGRIVRAVTGRIVAVGDVLFEIEADIAAAPTAPSTPQGPEERRHFGVPFEHGLHARPASVIAGALKPYEAEVFVHAKGRSANARSTTAMMSLGVRCGDRIEVVATGTHALHALDALDSLFTQPTPPAAAGMPKPATSERRSAVIACRGIAVGPAVQWTQAEIAVPEAGRGVTEEREALKLAIGRVREHLKSLAAEASGEQLAVLEAHVELVDDPELARHAADLVARGQSAGHAWRQATRATVALLSTLEDPRMRERTADLRDLENQVLRVLVGKGPSSSRELPLGAIVIADELLPSQLAAMDRERLAGIVMARGGATSHVAIIAASQGIPALVAAGRAVLDVPEGTIVILDAEEGRLHADPKPEQRAQVERSLAQRAVEKTADLARAGEPGATKDGTHIAVYANLGSLDDAKSAVTHGAEGCGLLRTEFLFLDRREAPDEDEQLHAYQSIADALGDRPLTIRTLDIGGDKPIAYLPMPHEDNPALGLRGLRTSLWRPELLHTQLRAILRVKPASQVRILLPMVTDASEIRLVRSFVDEHCRALGLDSAPALGIMIETPASAILADQLVNHADFLSIGTNDLSQYTLAMDRGHPELASQLDALHPSVLRLIALAADAGRSAGKEVAVCGGLGSDVTAIPILVGLGVDEVSAVPAAIPRIKRVLRERTLAECEALAREALLQSTAADVRALTGAKR